MQVWMFRLNDPISHGNAQLTGVCIEPGWGENPTRHVRTAERLHPEIAMTFDYSALAAASRLATSATFSICAVLSMRFMKPLSAVPGPSSMNRVNPCASK